MHSAEAPTRRVTLLHRLLYLLYRAALAFLRRVPIATARRLGRGAGLLYRLCARQRWHWALDNLAHALPELDARTRVRTARESFASFGATLFDATVSLDGDPAQIAKRFDVDGWEHIEAVEQRGTGYAIMSAHWGAWEALAGYLGLALGELHIISRPPTNPLMVRDFHRIRRRYGHALLHKRRAGRRMLRVLENGGRIGILIDQRVRPKDGILEPFLGQLAWTSPLLAFLTRKTNTPVVPVYCAPTAGGRFHVQVMPPIEPTREGPDQAARLTRAYLASVEALIRQRPELWMWMHRRWQRSARVRAGADIARYRARSGLAPEATFATWQWSASHSEVRRAALALTYEETVEHGCHALIHRVDPRPVEAARPTGAPTGASPMMAPMPMGPEHLASAIGHALIDAGHEVRRVRAADLVADIRAGEARGHRTRVRRRLDVPAMLIIDRIGEVAADPAACERLRALVLRRRGRRATLLAAHGAAEPWRTWLDESAPVITLPAPDRLQVE